MPGWLDGCENRNSTVDGGGAEGSGLGTAGLGIPRGATPSAGFRPSRDGEKILQHHAEDVV